MRLSMPLYSGGRTQSAVRKAVAEQSHAEYALEDARRAVNAATWDAWSEVMTGIAQVQALEAAKKSAQMAVDANRLGYSVGVRVSIDVLEVQGQLSETVQKLSQARYDTLLAQLKLKAAVGALQGSDLISINALLHH
nr:TolC family protein [Pseudomonas sp. PDM30]